MFDIAIVGAGPAGSTLARLLGNRYRVLLLDKRNMHKPYDGGPTNKCCGGLLAPDAQKVLGMMGLALPQDVLVGPQIFVVRTIDLQKKRERYYQRFYINLDREKFDRWLFSLVPDSVDVRSPAICKDIRVQEKVYQLQITQNGRSYFEQARCLIGADGAASVVRKKLFPRDHHMTMYAAVQERFAAEEAPPYFSVFFDSDLTDFYGWTIPKGDSLLLGAALHPRRQTAAAFEKLKGKLRAYGYPLDQSIKREGAYMIRPYRAPRYISTLPAAALIGEAAGWISPSSAEGFSYAFRSALMAARCLQPGIDGFTQRYEHQSGQLRRNIVIKNLKLPFMYRPWMRNMVMALGIEAVDIMIAENEPGKNNS